MPWRCGAGGAARARAPRGAETHLLSNCFEFQTLQPKLVGIARPPKSSDLDMAFADTLKTLPAVSHLAALRLVDAESGAVVATIENKPGQTGSLVVYHHLGEAFGAITPEAAARGLELYGEHTADARANPGKHPNVDRLIGLLASGKTLRVTVVPKG